MHADTRWIGLTALLGAAVGVAGCVATAQPTPAFRGRGRPAEVPSSPELRIPASKAPRGPDIPLVPVPPPPLGQPAEEAKTARAGGERPVPTMPRAGAVVPAGASAVTPRAPAESTAAASSAIPAETAAPSTPTRLPVVGMPDPPATVVGAGATPRQLYQAAKDRYARFDSYIVRLSRREVVKEKMGPEELLLVKFRKNPWSVYFKWLGKEGQGREVVYVKDRHDNKIHSKLAAGDIPFMAAGKRMALAPDSILVRSASRHPISEAGIGASIGRIGKILEASENGDRRVGTLSTVGPVNRPEFDRPVMGLEHQLPPGFDSSLPRGGRRTYFFDPETGLPMLITARDARSQEVEYYRYDRLQEGVKLDDHDFDPDRLWGGPARTAGR